PVTAAPRHAATKLLVAAVRPGMHVVDVGAHAGAFTLLLARAVGPTGRVFAFEPRASHRRALHGHLVQNGLAERVTVLPFGLADEYAERPLAALGDGPAAERARVRGGAAPRCGARPARHRAHRPDEDRLR